MSLSKEYQEYHLTPKGWLEGSFKADSLGQSIQKQVPQDRVLTIHCYDELTHHKAKPYFYDKIIWEHEDKERIDALKKQFGEKPDWFGYKKIL